MTNTENRVVYLHTHAGRPKINFNRSGKTFSPEHITRASWKRINRCIRKCDGITASNSEGHIWVGFWFDKEQS